MADFRIMIYIGFFSAKTIFFIPLLDTIRRKNIFLKLFFLYSDFTQEMTRTITVGAPYAVRAHGIRIASAPNSFDSDCAGSIR